MGPADKLISRLKKLKPNQSFPLKDAYERVRLLQLARAMRNAGAIKIKVRTWKNPDGGYTAIAVAL